MSDGLNDARAMRIAEVMTDYNAILAQTASYSTYLQGQEPALAGTAVLRQVIASSASLLSRPVPNFQDPPSPGDETKVTLQRIILDAAARRFVAWRLHQRAVAAIRWFQRRNELLQGKPPTAKHQQALSAIDNSLRQEILAVTDQKVFQELNAKDVAAANWTAEMPNLAKIQQYVQANVLV